MEQLRQRKEGTGLERPPAEAPLPPAQNGEGGPGFPGLQDRSPPPAGGRQGPLPDPQVLGRTPGEEPHRGRLPVAERQRAAAAGADPGSLEGTLPQGGHGYGTESSCGNNQLGSKFRKLDN